MSRARNTTSTGANADRGKYFELVKLDPFDASEFKDSRWKTSRCVVDAERQQSFTGVRNCSAFAVRVS